MSSVFSSRFQWDWHPNEVSRLLEEKRAQDTRILDLTESNPTRAGFDYPADILGALSDPRGLRYDPQPRGLLSAREAVSRYYAVRGFHAPVSRILLTASTSEAYSYLFKLLTDPGDEVLVPRPSYPLFDFLAAMEHVQVRQYPLRYDGLWHIDFQALEEALNPKTRAIVVVNPNNPTGSYLKRDEWERLDRIAAERNLAVLSDEVFSDFGFAPDPARVPVLASMATALTFSMSGLSKIAGLPQMKLGWILAGGARHETALDHLEWIADTYLSVGTPVQVALPSMLEASAAVREQMLQRIQANLAFLCESLRGSACQILNAEGGWYAILQVPRTRSEEDSVLGILRERDVLVQPGFFYDFESEAFLVLSLLTGSPIFEEGVRRMKSLLEIWA